MISLCLQNSRTNGASFWRSGGVCVIRPAHQQASREHWTSIATRLTLVFVFDDRGQHSSSEPGFRSAALNNAPILGFISSLDDAEKGIKS
ncbi:MAG: hypothetical protein DMG57_04920 [Acidobacteria bacterium]|nr:MAG: hypothetical protein DMG57_04920 [Acidobacteriota bacterium]